VRSTPGPPLASAVLRGAHGPAARAPDPPAKARTAEFGLRLSSGVPPRGAARFDPARRFCRGGLVAGGAPAKGAPGVAFRAASGRLRPAAGRGPDTAAGWGARRARYARAVAASTYRTRGGGRPRALFRARRAATSTYRATRRERWSPGFSEPHEGAHGVRTAPAGSAGAGVTSAFRGGRRWLAVGATCGAEHTAGAARGAPAHRRGHGARRARHRSRFAGELRTLARGVSGEPPARARGSDSSAPGCRGSPPERTLQPPQAPAWRATRAVAATHSHADAPRRKAETRRALRSAGRALRGAVKCARARHRARAGARRRDPRDELGHRRRPSRAARCRGLCPSGACPDKATRGA
jgi:hypothetical protein